MWLSKNSSFGPKTWWYISGPILNFFSDYCLYPLKKTFMPIQLIFFIFLFVIIIKLIKLKIIHTYSTSTVLSLLPATPQNHHYTQCSRRKPPPMSSFLPKTTSVVIETIFTDTITYPNHLHRHCPLSFSD